MIGKSFKSGFALLAAAFASMATMADGMASVSASDAVDLSVERGLAFLAQEKNRDGSFKGRYGKTSAIPSLAGMAFLSKGYTPRTAKYGAEINSIVDWVLGVGNAETGYFGEAEGGRMYAHCISTLFLSEVSGMVDSGRQKRIDAILPKAVQLILSAQQIQKDPRHQGGWRYNPDSTDSDSSASGWALMALRSARLNGANVPGSAINDAVDYLRRLFSKTSGGLGYQWANGEKVTLTGAGILCLELCGRHHDPDSLAAAKYLMENYSKLLTESNRHYGMYYAAQGLFQIGGENWREFSQWMYREWMPLQDASGAWSKGEISPAYCTAMMVLAFTVPYRQLPIYQRDETVDE